MASVHVYHEHGEEIRDVIVARRPDLDVIVWTSLHELEAHMGEAEILFASMPPRAGWSGATRLRLVQIMGAGVDQLLPSPDLPASVSIAGARGVFAEEASEHAIAMMLALTRAFATTASRQREHVWKQFMVGKLAGKTVALLGLGEIGRRIAKIADAIGMHVLGVSRRARPVPHVSRIALPTDMSAVLAAADFLVVCVPLTPQTKNMVCAREIEGMPEHSSIVSLGRGGIVDEAAVLDALRSGHLGGAALDVFEKEPLGPDSPFWDEPNTIVTPHMAGAGVNYVERCVDIFVENVRRLERKEPLVNLIDRTLGY